VTKELLAHWRSEDRDRRLFFCQVEAAETAIFLVEAADKLGDTKAMNVIRAENARLNDSLPRLAFKMATGSGKTVVMGMLIAWQTLNKLANPYDRRFGHRFLIVTPGITIRDRLRVLLPNDPQTFYRSMDLVTPEQLDRLQAATIEITNYHAFIRREKVEAAALTKRILARGDTDAERFKETPGEMVRRVLRVFGNAKDVIVLNDEAHHCYTPAPPEELEEGGLDADERTEARQNQEEARVWFDGLKAVRDKIGVRAVFDVSATPFFLKGSGYAEGTLFPWVVSDFGLMDAIESGIVKVPRVPVSDDSMVGDLPKYRDLWVHVRDALPRKGLKDTTVGDGDPVLPKVLEGALESLYADYQRSYDEWQGAAMGRPPVFIVVCSNTSVSKLVHDWIAGYDRRQADGSTLPAPGKLPLFSNVVDGRWRNRPVSLLIDSMQLDRGDALDPAFKKAAAREIEEYKREYALRFPAAPRTTSRTRTSCARSSTPSASRTSSAPRSAASSPSRCSLRAGTPTPSRTSWGSGPSGPSSCASRSSAARCAVPATTPTRTACSSPSTPRSWGSRSRSSRRPARVASAGRSPSSPSARFRSGQACGSSSRASSATATRCPASA
jgi:type III restriction enzyme